MDARHKSKLMNARQGTALQAATLSIRRRRGKHVQMETCKQADAEIRWDAATDADTDTTGNLS